MKSKDIYLRCDDNAEMVVFDKYNFSDGEINYEIAIKDAYCGGDYMGIKGRLKRAWNAFWRKPICYTGVYCQNEERMKKFLIDCLDLIEEQNEKRIEPSDIMDYLDKVKEENPNQVIIVETPKGSVELKIGDALIYEDGYGNVVIDSE